MSAGSTSKYNGCAFLADDDEMGLIIMEGQIRSFGFNVKTANGGTSMMKLIDECNGELPDVIFLDYLMPDMNGADTAKAIRSKELTKNPVIIGVTAADSAEEIAMLKASGMDDILKKPIDNSALGEMLEKYLSALKSDSAADMLTDDACEVDEDDIYDVLFEKLEALLPELDVQFGIHNCLDSKKQYYGVLPACLSGLKNISEEIKANTNNRDVLRRDVHSLKSVFNNLGAPSIAKQMAEHEAFLRDTTEEFTSEKIESVLSIMDRYRTVISEEKENFENELDESSSVGEDNSASISDADLSAKIDEIINYINMFMPMQAEESIDALLPLCKAETKKVLRASKDALGGFMYDEALKILKEQR